MNCDTDSIDHSHCHRIILESFIMNHDRLIFPPFKYRHSLKSFLISYLLSPKVHHYASSFALQLATVRIHSAQILMFHPKTIKKHRMNMKNECRSQAK